MLKKNKGNKKEKDKQLNSIIEFFNKIISYNLYTLNLISKPFSRFFNNIAIDAKKVEWNPYKKIKKSILNTKFAKNIIAKRTLKKEALIDLNSKDAERSDKKIVYKYVVKTPEGKFKRGIFDAYSKLDVHSFLYTEGYEVYSIKTSDWINLFYKQSNFKKVKLKDLVFFLTQLSTFIKVGVPVTESVRILSKQVTKKETKRLYERIIYELTMGETFSSALEKQGKAFPALLINMVRTSELTGNLADTLDDMSEYYMVVIKNKKELISALTYPAVVSVMAVVVIIFVLTYIVPRFVDVYESAEITLPAITIITLNISFFLQTYIIHIIIGTILFILLLILLYKKVTFFKHGVQWFLMHIPVFGKIIKYNQIVTFSKTFGTLLDNGVNIVDTVQMLQRITDNEVYKAIMYSTIANISKGEPISEAFENHWAIPKLAYFMLLTGERTGQPSEMMLKVADYFQSEQENLVTQVKSLVEPLIIVFLAVTVGTILLSVVIPMFSLYQNISI
ncbi:MAG: type II secretion system F family protein [Bacilli bacterium]